MGQMKWMCPTSGTDGEKILYLRESENSCWKPYKEFPYFYQPDTHINGVKTSRGFRTAQHLIKLGWSYVPSDQQVEGDGEQTPMNKEAA